MNKKVAIIIPCRNEERYIARCIHSVLNSDYPKELISIYVCDGMSDDSTRPIVKEIADKSHSTFLLDNERKTTPYALNIGLKKADAAVKIILGAHTEVERDFVRKNIEVLDKNKKIACAGGLILNVYENRTSEIIGHAMSSSFGVGNAHFRTGSKEGYVDTVAFGAYRAEVFEEIGYFDESLTRNQDDEFNFRLIRNGYKIWLSSEIKSKYYVRGSFKKLIKQYYQYGLWKVFVNKKHHTITTFRQLVPLMFVLYLIAGAVISACSPILWSAYFAILLCYFLIAFIFALRAKADLSDRLKIVYTFFILHSSYGWGYLHGIFNFLILNQQPKKQHESSSR